MTAPPGPSDYTQHFIHPITGNDSTSRSLRLHSTLFIPLRAMTAPPGPSDYTALYSSHYGKLQPGGRRAVRTESQNLSLPSLCPSRTRDCGKYHRAVLEKHYNNYWPHNYVRLLLRQPPCIDHGALIITCRAQDEHFTGWSVTNRAFFFILLLRPLQAATMISLIILIPVCVI